MTDEQIFFFAINVLTVFLNFVLCSKISKSNQDLLYGIKLESKRWEKVSNDFFKKRDYLEGESWKFKNDDQEGEENDEDNSIW